MDINFDTLMLTMSYIPGSVVREELAATGALIRDSDVASDPSFMFLSPSEREQKRIHEAHRVLHTTLDRPLIEEIYKQLQTAHSSRVILNDIKYGNIIIHKESKKPYFIDFESARRYPGLPLNCFNILRDRNIERFNDLFGTQKVTYRRLLDRLTSNGMEVYAPAYLSAGLTHGKIWDIDVGDGRWHYILKHKLPTMVGKRILDLGANNALNALQMLRYGAREVVAVELSISNVLQGHFLKEGFEWADNSRYNLTYIQSDMRELNTLSFGTFDLVLALCSIYYLDDLSMARLVKHISTLTDVLVLQCNLTRDIDRQDPYVYEKAGLDYNLRLLKENGFRRIEVCAPHNYSRPLLIGRKVC